MASTSRGEAQKARGGGGRSTADVFGRAAASEQGSETAPAPAFDRFVRASSGSKEPTPGLADALAASKAAAVERKNEEEKLGEAEIVEADKAFLKTFEEEERRAREEARQGENKDILEFRKARAEIVYELDDEESSKAVGEATGTALDESAKPKKRKIPVADAVQSVVVVKKRRKATDEEEKERPKTKVETPTPALTRLVTGYASSSSSSSSIAANT